MSTARVHHSLLHFTFPRSTNNFKAKILHTQSLFALTLVVLIFGNVLTASQSALPQVLGYAANISPSEVIRLTNEQRLAHGQDALVENPLLSQAAKEKGLNMIANDYWAHVAPDGTEPWVFFARAGYKYRYAGENLARDFTNPQATVDAWMASLTHRENLLSAKYKEIGVAVVEGDLNGTDTTIVVQLFGTRADTLPTVPVAKAENVNAPPEPTVAPTPQVASAKAPVIASSGTTHAANPFDVSKGFYLFLIGGLTSVMAVDAVFVSRKNIHRSSARPFAQLSFLGMILAILVIARAGAIL